MDNNYTVEVRQSVVNKLEKLSTALYQVVNDFKHIMYYLKEHTLIMKGSHKAFNCFMQQRIERYGYIIEDLVSIITHSNLDEDKDLFIEALAIFNADLFYFRNMDTLSYVKTLIDTYAVGSHKKHLDDYYKDYLKSNQKFKIAIDNLHKDIFNLLSSNKNEKEIIKA